MSDWVPKKFKDKPWRTVGVIVAAFVVLLFAVVFALERLAMTLDVDWLQDQIGGFLGSETANDPPPTITIEGKD